VFVATPYAGVWISEDYGFSWHQSARPQPDVGAAEVTGALPVANINDVAVSPRNRDLAFAAADREGREPSLAGIYRTTDRGRTWKRVHTFRCGGDVKSVSQIVFAPDDPQRVYAAGGCGVAISSDAGAHWTEVHPPGTVAVRNRRDVWHLAVSGRLSRRDEDRIIVAAGPNSIWLSREDGKAGSWVLDPGATPAVLPRWFGSKTGRDPAFLSAQLLALEPGNPEHVYLVHNTHSNGPSYYHGSDPTKSKYFGPEGVISDIPVVYDTDQDNTFDAGEMVIDRGNPNPSAGVALADEARIKFVDRNSNGMLNNGEQVVFDTDNDNVYDQGEPLLARNGAAPGNLRVNDALADDARIKYVRVTYLGRESVYGPRHANIGSIWLGDLSKLSARAPGGRGEWKQLPGPPIYTGSGSSGAAAVYTHAMRKGFLVFMSDGASIQVSVGRPGAQGWQGWYRLAGLSGSEAHRHNRGQTRFVHPDPHAIAISPDFKLSLKRSTEPSPYDLNAELDKCGGGRLWTSNDGGVYMNDDCAELDPETVTRRWQPAETGLNTLWTLNVVGSTKLDFKRALYTGTTHDDDFYSMDDGQTWKSPIWACGDCDMWYGNIYDMNRILRISPRNRGSKGDFDLFVETGNKAPDAGKTPESIPYLNGMRQFSISGNMIQGTRPVVQSYPNDTPPAKGDYVAIWQQNSTTRVLMRAHDSIDKSATNSGFTQVGPALPNTARVVQVAGGHARPVYYLGDGTNIWRGETDNRGIVPRWDRIVPSGDGTAAVARRFFVNPWNPDLLYLIDDNEVRVSTTRGRTWNPERGLTRAISANDTWQVTNCGNHHCLLNDMAFDPTNRNRRFAAGLAGVFFTADGSNWFRLLDTRAVPSRPLSLWFDPISNQEDATLFVACIGRGILRLHPIPNQAPRLTMTIAGGGLELAQPDWRRLGSAWLERTKKHSGDSSTGLGADNATFGTMHQAISVPCDAESATLSFWWSMTTAEGREGGDLLRAYVETEHGTVSLFEATSTSAPRDVWTRSEVELRELGCGEMVVHFEATLNEDAPTMFYVDDVELSVSGAGRKGGERISIKE
ncbi:MAG: WD40/YVTN/BNR-like repeat-containing protein, partial [bacterium]